MLRALAFWFLRHGETDWNARALSQGALDVPLNAHGRAQAEHAGELLADKRIASIIASPFLRARETAEIVARRLGLPVRYEPLLREAVFPGKEGTPVAGWFDAWLLGTTPPGAESFRELVARAERAVRLAQAEPAPVLVVSHGGFFRALRDVMRLPTDVRTPNGVPILCTPPTRGEAWTIEAAGGASLAGPPGISG